MTRTTANCVKSWILEKELSLSLDTSTCEDLALHLPKFFLEARKQNGECFPARTLSLYKDGVQRYLQEHNSSFGRG
jgi:hypothetical protein